VAAGTPETLQAAHRGAKSGLSSGEKIAVVEEATRRSGPSTFPKSLFCRTLH